MKIQVKCHGCRKVWEVYPRGEWQNENNAVCPFCGLQIEPQTWEREIVPAFGAFLDANRELLKDVTGYGAPRFKVNFIN